MTAGRERKTPPPPPPPRRTAERPPPPRPRHAGESISRGISEFGEAMARMMERTPGAIGAVLADGRGEPIDYAHDREAIDELEIQIVGAQLGQCMERTRVTSLVFGLGEPTILVDGTTGHLLSSIVGSEYLLTVVLARSANIARAMNGFSDLAESVRRLL